MGDNQTDNCFTRFFIPFRMKDYSRHQKVKEEGTPNKNIWKKIDEDVTDKLTRNLLPFPYEMFHGKYPECIPYTIRDSKTSNDEIQYQAKKMLSTNYQLDLGKEEKIDFSINDIKLFLFPTNAVGVFIIEIEPHQKDVEELIKLNYNFREIHHGRIPTFSKPSKSSDHPAFEEIKDPSQKREKFKNLQKDLMFSRSRLWKKKGNTLKFDKKARRNILNDLWHAQNRGVLTDDKVEHPKFKLKELCELLCGDLFFFEEHWKKKKASRSHSKEVKNLLKKHWKYMIPTGRLAGFVYLSTNYDGREEQRKRDLFHLRRFYKRTYHPSTNQLTLENNEEVLKMYEDITVGISREGVAFLDERGDFSERIRTHYQTVVLLSLVMRWRLTQISTKLINVTTSRESELKKNPEGYRNKLSNLRDKIMDFDVSTSLNEVSDISHINKMYEKFNGLLGTKKYFSETKQSIDEVDEYLKRLKNQEEEKLQKTIQIILFIFLPLTAASGFFGGTQMIQRGGENTFVRWFPLTDYLSEALNGGWIAFFIYLAFFYLVSLLMLYGIRKRKYSIENQ